MRISENHNSLGCEQPLGLDVNQSPDAQGAFWPMPGLISCTGATGSVGVTCHAHATQMAGLKYPLEPTAAGSTRLLHVRMHDCPNNQIVQRQSADSHVKKCTSNDTKYGTNDHTRSMFA